MNLRSLLLFVSLSASLILADCSLPRVEVTFDPTATNTLTPTATGTIIPTDTPFPTIPPVALGLAENPIILALPPTAKTQAEITAANQLAAQIRERTGYAVVTIIPDSYTALIEALSIGNAHIVLLDPYAYVLAYQRGLVQAAYAEFQDGEGLYGAQFIAARKSGLQTYFNPITQENLVTDPTVALKQLANKKPCWSDEVSASGYVIPLGYLNSQEILTQPAAFVGGHPTVVRSLYASGICDFGATYIDARKFPSLEDQFPDLLEQVYVIWRIPKVIPYRVLALSTQMPEDLRTQISALIPAILQTESGRSAFVTAYNINELQAVNDGYYNEFRAYVQASQVDLLNIVK